MSINIFTAIMDIEQIMCNKKISKFNIILKYKRKKEKIRLMKILKVIEFKSFILTYDFFIEYINFLAYHTKLLGDNIKVSIDINDGILSLHELSINKLEYCINIKLRANGIIKISYNNLINNSFINLEYIERCIFINDNSDEVIIVLIKHNIYTILKNYINSWDIYK